MYEMVSFPPIAAKPHEGDLPLFPIEAKWPTAGSVKAHRHANCTDYRRRHPTCAGSMTFASACPPAAPANPTWMSGFTFARGQDYINIVSVVWLNKQRALLHVHACPRAGSLLRTRITGAIVPHARVHFLGNFFRIAFNYSVKCRSSLLDRELDAEPTPTGAANEKSAL